MKNIQSSASKTKIAEEDKVIVTPKQKQAIDAASVDGRIGLMDYLKIMSGKSEDYILDALVKGK